MIVNVLCAESLGARGLSCSIHLKQRNILIDPGVALGWSRHGLLPHPFQIAVGAEIRRAIMEELKKATDVVFSHYHGDHCPLRDPNPYQLGLDETEDSLSCCRIWARGCGDASPAQQERRDALKSVLEDGWQDAEGMRCGPLEFSLPVPHGEHGDKRGMVMMSRIEDDGVTFVHASDIQLLNEETVGMILDWKPDIVLASGPPLYRYSSPSFQEKKERAWRNALNLSRNTNTLVIDHHLLRSEEGARWLDGLRRASTNRVLCAADFMGQRPLLLEAWRSDLYDWVPVPPGWHESYQKREINADDFRAVGWQALVSNGKTEPCKWYSCCPIKRYTDAGSLDRCWVEHYCLVGNRRCVRYMMEEEGRCHPDNLLPDGGTADHLPQLPQ